MGIAEDLIIIILVGLAGGLAVSRMKLPPLIGYIVAGIVIGPHTGGITVADIPRVEMLAEIGVALLLFSIGLDFSFKELKQVRGIALIGTPIQVIALIAFGFGVGRFTGMTPRESVVLGMVISLSSTMVVIKILMGRGLIGTLSSRVMIGILLVQDLAAIPLMLVIQQLGAAGGGFPQFMIILLKAAAILGAIVVVGSRIIPWVLKLVVKMESRELFLIAITAIGLGIGYLTHVAGLSLAFGAFVAGMVVNGSDYSHQALSDIIPLRDIFGLVFFTSVGMLLDPAFIYENLGLIFLLVLLVIAGKLAVFSALSLSFRYYNIMPLALGLGLAQIGEFSFVLVRTGLASNVVDREFFSLVLAVSVITMIASPFLSLLAAPLYRLKRRYLRSEEVHTVNMPEGGLARHIVIAGGGRVGFQIASILRDGGYPFVVVEQDFRRFEKSKSAGFPVIYGDAGKEPVLAGAKIMTARLVIITVPHIVTAREIVAASMNFNPGVKIIARADDLTHMRELFSMNIFEVVQPEFEASLEIIRQSLLLLDMPLTEIFGFTDDIRRRNYSNAGKDNAGHSLMASIRNAPFLLEMSWIEVERHSRIAGKSIGRLEVRSRTGASIVGVMRNREFIPNPDADFVFRVGDYIALIGQPEGKKKFEELMAAR